MSSTSIKDLEVIHTRTKHLNVNGMKELLGVKNHIVFWRKINTEMTDEDWIDENGKDCKPKKIIKNHSFFMPNQISCVCKKYGIKDPNK